MCHGVIAGWWCDKIRLWLSINMGLIVDYDPMNVAMNRTNRTIKLGSDSPHRKPFSPKL